MLLFNCIYLLLQLIHDTVIDTSVVFPHSRGPPYKKALRTLCGDILQKIIQNDGIHLLSLDYLFNAVTNRLFLFDYHINSWRSRQCRGCYRLYGADGMESETGPEDAQVREKQSTKVSQKSFLIPSNHEASLISFSPFFFFLLFVYYKVKEDLSLFA